ncbi:MAG TPA: type II and III secretion system protein family protein [Hyphomicrobium sp.]|nr:type II and III secretion system protein family protein [Hyphomicrobium sp.]
MWRTFAYRGAARRVLGIFGFAPVSRAAAEGPVNTLSGSSAAACRLTGLCVIALGAIFGLCGAGLERAHAEGRQVEAGPTGSGRSFDGVVKRLSVLVKKSQVVEIGRPYVTALIAEAEIADVVPLSDRSIYVVGKKVGSTRLTVVGENQSIVRIVEVDVTPDVDDLRVKLRENLPDADIRVDSINGGIMLSGAVRDAPTIERAVAIALRYAPDAVTNALTVASPQQVMLEVRFVEASRSAARELGIGTRGRGPSAAWDTDRQVFNRGDDIALSTADLLSGTAPFGTMLARVLEGGTNVDVMIRALEMRSLARRLAEPNLVTTSGDTASFLAGGEFPFPVSAADNKITIEFKQFGVALAFTPTVLNDGLINLKIAPEVSDIDDTNSVSVNNVRIPGLAVRRANTTVELKDGQSLAIAGLLQHQHAKNQQQLPWIGQVPVLGALFRSAEYQKNESDLVIIVTPRLVKPKRPGETFKTPIDEPVASNDVDFFIGGRQEITQEDERRRRPKLYGHIIDPGTEVRHVSAK